MKKKDLIKMFPGIMFHLPTEPTELENWCQKMPNFYMYGGDAVMEATYEDDGETTEVKLTIGYVAKQPFETSYTPFFNGRLDVGDASYHTSRYSSPERVLSELSYMYHMKCVE